MTSAEELREAANLMRERAEGASILSPPPWRVGEAGTPAVPWVRSAQPDHSSRGGLVVAGNKVDCEHIAGMHPGVALAVADWLEQEADECCEPLSGALKVARAYLGTPVISAPGTEDARED